MTESSRQERSKCRQEKPKGQSRDTGNTGHKTQNENKQIKKQNTENKKRIHQQIRSEPLCSRMISSSCLLSNTRHEAYSQLKSRSNKLTKPLSQKTLFFFLFRNPTTMFLQINQCLIDFKLILSTETVHFSKA